jgi:hypothetical protein
MRSDGDPPTSGLLITSGTNQYNYKQSNQTIAHLYATVSAYSVSSQNNKYASGVMGITDGTTKIVLESVYGSAPDNVSFSFTSGGQYDLIFNPTTNFVTIYKDYVLTGSVSLSSISAGPWLIYFYTWAQGASSRARGDATIYSLHNNYINSKIETGDLIVTSGDNIKNVFLVPRYNNTGQSNTSQSFDISIDGGTTWPLTNQVIGSFIDTSSYTGSALRIKFNLNGSATNYSEINDYYVQVYT